MKFEFFYFQKWEWHVREGEC